MMHNDNNDDILKSYLNEIRRHPLLSAEQEKKLSRQILKGSEKAKEELINGNLRLVVKIATGYKIDQLPLLDVIQEGNLGLMRASEKFDYKKNVRFSTYAAFWIKQSISRAIVNKCRTIRLPHRKEELMRRITRYTDEYKMAYNTKPDEDTLCKNTGISSEEMHSLIGMAECNVSLDTSINDNNNVLLDLCEDQTYTPEKLFFAKELKNETESILSQFPENEREVLKYRFSFNDGKKYTLKTISEIMNVSPETIRQIEMRALRRLKKDFSDVAIYLCAS